MFKRHHGPQGDLGILTWQAASRVMNPTIPESVVAEALEQDESAARAEWLAEWRRDIEAFLSREVVDGCVEPGRQGLPPVVDVAYTAFVDPSGGSSDSFTLAVAHAETEGGQVVAVLDHVSERTAPFNAEQAVAEFAATLRRYRCGGVTGDRYAGEWPPQAFRRHGIEYVSSEAQRRVVRGGVADVHLGTRAAARPPSVGGAALGAGAPDVPGRAGFSRPPAERPRRPAASVAGACVLAASQAADDGPVLAANLAPERRGRLLDEREFELLRRGDY